MIAEYITEQDTVRYILKREYIYLKKFIFILTDNIESQCKILRIFTLKNVIYIAIKWKIKPWMRILFQFKICLI